jgi:hypothetical protein
MNRKILLLLCLAPQFICSGDGIIKAVGWFLKPYHDPYSAYDQKTCNWLFKWHEKAEQKAKEAEQKAKEAEQKAKEAEQKAKEAEQKAKEAEQKAKEAEVERRAAEFFKQKEQEHEKRAAQNVKLGEVLAVLRASIEMK